MSLNQKSKQRRRDILKAAVGAPVIFTLPTGAALAAASLTCKDKSLKTAQTTPPNGVIAVSDTWMRYKVTGKNIKIQNDNSTLRKGFTLNSKWYRVDLVTGQIVDVTLILKPGYTITDNGEFYYLLVDHTKYEGTPGSPQNFVYLGTAIAAPIAGHSCWNSISTVNNKLPGNVVN